MECLTVLTHIQVEQNYCKHETNNSEINNLPVGVKGLILAAGLSFLLYAAGTALGLSSPENRRLLGAGVGGVIRADDFSMIVFGVSGLSNNLKALTLLYGGLYSRLLNKGDVSESL